MFSCSIAPAWRIPTRRGSPWFYGVYCHGGKGSEEGSRAREKQREKESREVEATHDHGGGGGGGGREWGEKEE